MTRTRLFFSLIFPTILYFYSIVSSANAYYGATLSTVIIGTEPENLHGVQLMGVYDPQLFQWRKFNLYFDGGFSHFWQMHTPHHRNLNIVSAAPVIRYTFRHWKTINPYLELSIGLSYLSNTRIDNRNLGIHFAFQDRMGVGLAVGETHQFSIGIHAMHYSNAHFSTHNSGISMPLVLDVSYRFQ